MTIKTIPSTVPRMRTRNTRSKASVSLITATLDAGSALQRTHRSIAEQREPAAEWILKDGGSTDKSLEALAELPCSELRVVRSPDKNIFDALNQALRIAGSEYIHVLGAGDTFSDSDALARITSAIEEAGRPDLLYCSARHEPSGTIWTHPPRLHRWFLFRGAVCHQAQTWRRETLLALGGFEPVFRLAADRELMIRACSSRGICSARLDETLIGYSGEGASEDPANATLLEHELAMIRMIHFSDLERTCFGILNALTFPKLRANWNDKQSSGAVPQLYRSIRSCVRRYI